MTEGLLGFRKLGDAGLMHRRRPQPGPRRKKTEFRERVLARFQERYADFGPTLAAEKLAEEGLGIDHETLRRWLAEAGRWTVGRKRHKHRAWRERKECFGQMVQLDGSHHDWFEERGPKAVLGLAIRYSNHPSSLATLSQPFFTSAINTSRFRSFPLINNVSIGGHGCYRSHAQMGTF